VDDWAVETTSPEQTRRLGRCLGQLIRQPLVVLLSGDLGAGKTCFTQGLALGLEVPEEEPVVSPTYTLMNPYHGRLELFHFDLYRLAAADDLTDLGLEDFLPGAGVAVVEWADRFSGLSAEYLAVEINHRGETGRMFRFQARGEAAAALLADLQAAWQGQEASHD
jgi:tRNA threonylcarbamoyladenosine biosynthesis protein TsaE